MNLVEVKEEDMARILAQIKAGRSVTIGQGSAQSYMLRQAADALGDTAILIRIEHYSDAESYVLLVIAHQLGGDTLQKTAQCLAMSSPGETGWQTVLDDGLRQRYLLVDGLSGLRTGRSEWDLPGLFASMLRPVVAWLESRSALATVGEAPRYDLVLRPDTRWGAQRLWALVEHNPERYALAITRELLLGDGSAQGWDETALVNDVWNGMPSDFRELVAFLAVHGRPIQKNLFERLTLVPDDTITRALELALVELHGRELSVPKLWYYAIERLDATAVRHRVLADAFARIARGEDGDASPVAVVEAHRHYAAIPDIERALQFSDFSIGPLLEAAVRQSRRGEVAKAAKSYEAVLKVDAARSHRFGRYLRAYALHYLHYNRARAGEEPIQETIDGYRAALDAWPENALFFSRLIRNLFVAKDEAAAMSALGEAYAKVPPHPLRDRALIVHTTDRLVARGLLLPAVFVWGEYQGHAGGDHEVEARLDARLGLSWQTDRVWADGLPAVDLEQPAWMKAVPVTDAPSWECSAGAFTRRGATRTEAVRATVRALIFDVLATRWRQQTGAMSITRARYDHPLWKQILTLGPAIVPDILGRIERQPDHWHAALVELTHENPVPLDESITVSQVCARWVEWGRKRGLQW